MLPIFESVLPIFLVVLAGIALKRAPFIDQGLWKGLEEFGFYILFPLYLFLTLAQADFDGIAVGPISVVYGGVLAILATVILAIWPLLYRAGVSAAQFTSIFQTTTRWNGFVALAIAERLAGGPGVAFVALLMGAIVIPINLVNIIVLVWFGGGQRHLTLLLKKVLSNPLVVGTAAGLIVHAAGIEIYAPIATAFDLLTRSALGLGLLMVGAGLRISDTLRPTPAALFAVAVKLIAFPIIVIIATSLAGFDGNTIRLAALAAGVPTAMNGYLLAKQMGGDADLYAAVATLQTAAAFFTIPFVLMLAG